MTRPLDRFPEFAEHVLARLRTGEHEYHDRSFSCAPPELIGELEQEALDLAGWGFVLWCRLRRLRQAAERLGSEEDA